MPATSADTAVVHCAHACRSTISPPQPVHTDTKFHHISPPPGALLKKQRKAQKFRQGILEWVDSRCSEIPLNGPDPCGILEEFCYVTYGATKLFCLRTCHVCFRFFWKGKLQYIFVGFFCICIYIYGGPIQFKKSRYVQLI